jgi:hypothetical protein
MCNDHEHYVGYSTTDYNSLCFRHSVIEAVKGFEVEVDVQAYEQRPCELCEVEQEAKARAEEFSKR